MAEQENENLISRIKNAGKKKIAIGVVATGLAATALTGVGVGGYFLFRDTNVLSPAEQGQYLTLATSGSLSEQVSGFEGVVVDEINTYLSTGDKTEFERSVQQIYDVLRLNSEAGFDESHNYIDHQGIRVFYTPNDGNVRIAYQGQDDGVAAVSNSLCDYLGDVLADTGSLSEGGSIVYNSETCNNRRAEQEEN